MKTNLFSEILANAAANPIPNQIVGLTTDHPQSHYGIPVLVDLEGNAYGPRDSVEHLPNCEAGGTAGTAGYLVAARANAGTIDLRLARLFCSQWPEGPQPDANLEEDATV